MTEINLMHLEAVEELVLEMAAASQATRRKVGAVLVDKLPSGGFKVVARGYNYHPKGLACENPDGTTKAEVVHAEAEVLGFAHEAFDPVLFTSHPPCDNCKALIVKAGVKDVRVVETFIKFDDGKLDYTRVSPKTIKSLAEMTDEDLLIWSQAIETGLVPASTIKGVLDVLVFGARKYKPNNWRNVEDPSRYSKALMRHMYTYLDGQQLDKDSQLEELKHIMTNIAFMLELGYTPKEHKSNNLLEKK